MKSVAFHTKCQLLPIKFLLTTAKRIHWYPFCEAFHRSMVSLTSSLLFGRLWCITGRLPTRRSMLLPRVRGGGTWLLLPWNIVVVGSYQSFPTLKIFSFCFRALKQENHTDFPVSWYSGWLLNEGSLPGQCLHFPLWTPEADFSQCQVCPFPVWPFGDCAGGAGAETLWTASILLPSLSLGLAPGTRHRCNFKACKMTGLTAMRRTESGAWKREQRDLGAAWSKKGQLKRNRGKQANSAECSEQGGGTVVGVFKGR